MYNSENGEAEPGWVRDEEKIFLLRHDKDGDEQLNLVSLLPYKNLRCNLYFNLHNNDHLQIPKKDAGSKFNINLILSFHIFKYVCIQYQIFRRK